MEVICFHACCLARASPCDQDRLGRFVFLTDFLQACEGVERPEEFPGDCGVVTEIHLPLLGGTDHEANGNRVVRVEIFGAAVCDDLLGASALGGGGDGEDAGFNAPRAEASPVRLRQSQDKGLFGGVLRLEGVAEALEEFLVFVLALFG